MTQAVVVIHGIGEQKPMDTLRGFVRAVWSEDNAVHHEHGVNTVWSKPEFVSGTFELRRLSTGRNKAGIRTDFFEFYWQHLVTGTTLSHVWSWTKLLLLRRPSTVPPALRGVWGVLVMLLIFSGATVLALTLPSESRFSLPGWAALVGGTVVVPLASYVLRRIVGDAARYLYPDSENIANRTAIRNAGVSLLAKLHERGYDRIIVVGHSLGSVIGYDILTHGWAACEDILPVQPNRVEQPALENLEAAARSGSWSSGSHGAGQRELLNELAALGHPWRVTDFITIGSPLAHADILLAADSEDLRRKQSERELPTCPPLLERKGQEATFAYPHPKKSGRNEKRPRTLHHGAVFGPTRWTNLYAPARRILWGDVIGGPVAPVFGQGVLDREVATSAKNELLSHTRYWDMSDGGEPSTSVRALREALDLLDCKKR